MKFGRPEVLQLFWILPPVAALAFYRFYFKRRMRRRIGRLEKLRQISRIPQLSREIAHSVCLLVALASSIAALAMPRLEQLSYEPLRRGLDIIFLLDTSPSMGASDIQPSRLAKARAVIEDFLWHKQDDDRAALVGFSESSMTYSYLTSDAESLLFYFDYLDTGEESLYGTNLGAAIRSGLAVVERERAIAPNQPPRQTVLVMVSDGEDHRGEVAEPVELARQAKLKVYAIGIGSRQGADIPIRVQGQRQFLLNERGVRLTSAIQEEALKSIAASTGANYYRAASGEQLEQALAHLLVQERPIQGYQQKTVPQELYPYLLLAAFLCSLGLVVL